MIEEKDPELIGFFDILYQSMDPFSKNEKTQEDLKKKIIILCYQIAGLRNKQITLGKKELALHMSSTGTSAAGIDLLSKCGITTSYKTVIREKNEIINRHEENLEEYIEKNIDSLIIGLIDDYHDIHQSRNPANEKLSQVAHMANTMIHVPKISPIPYFSNINEPVHNPLNVDVDLLSWVLTSDYISLFGVSYVERKSSWFCVSDSSNLTEDSLIDHLTVHSYESDLHINHTETRKMDTVKLVDFIPQELKSLNDYLNSINTFIKIPLIDNYLSEFIIPVPADYPGQYFLRKAITLRQIYQENSGISDKITNFVPLLGPLHVSLNTRETTFKKYYPFFNLLYKDIFQRQRNISLTPQPWMIDLILHLAYSGWSIIRKHIIIKFQTIRNTEYQIFLELLDSIVPSTLDIYAILFREGHFQEYIETVFRLWTVMMRFKRKNYDKIMIAFLSDIFYWLTIDHPIYDILKEHLSEFNEYFIENFHSLVRRNTMRKNFNPDSLRRDALTIDFKRHNSEFLNPFLNLKKYPYTKKKIDMMAKKSAVFLLGFFQKILANKDNGQIISKSKKKTYTLPTFNLEVQFCILPSGYHTSKPPD